MGELFSYSLQVNVFLVLAVLIYNVLMSKERQFTFNRVALLAIVVLSVCAPFAIGAYNAGGYGEAVRDGAALDIEALMMSASELTVSEIRETESASVVYAVILWIYLAGLIFMALRLMWAFGRMIALIAKARKIRMESYTIVLLRESRLSPFSWCRYVVMSEEDYTDSSAAILTHELCHLSYMHWLDLLFMEFVKILCWYNPAIWMLQNSLKDVHEYQADEAVIRSGADIRQYQMLLIKKAVGVRFPSLVNSLNHSKLKKRITMMYNQKSSAWRRMRSLALLPAAAAAVLVVSIPSVASAVDEFAQTKLVNEKVSESKSTKNDSSDEINKGFAGEDVVMPQYPGGDEELYAYMAQEVKYPEKAMKDNVQGRVVVRFTVAETGKIKDPEIFKSVSPELDAEALRVVSSLPDFIPAKKNGKPVAVAYVIPVQFKLTSTGKKEHKETALDVNTAGEVVKVEKDGATVFDKTEGSADAQFTRIKLNSGHGKPQPAIFVNGVEVSFDNLYEIDKEDIECITVKKNNLEKYPGGEMYITLKKETAK